MRIALIGAGAMGGAMLAAWLRSNTTSPSDIAVFDKDPSSDILAQASHRGVKINPPHPEVNPDITVIAIKPQVARDVLPDYATVIGQSLVFSIMAGLSCANISQIIGTSKIVRGMPNLGVQVNEGVTGLYASESIETLQRASIETLVRPTGVKIWVNDEADLDIVTAISGSGPAYFFLLAEALEEVGHTLGLSAADARVLAAGTLRGAGALLAGDIRSAEEWRDAVTSPGGVTAAALSVLDYPKSGLRELALETIKAGVARATSLSK